MIKNNLFFAGFIAASVFASSVVHAQCSPVSEFSENFDTLFCCDMGVVPTCWNSIVTADGGNQIISNSSPASSPRNVYQTGYNKVSVVIMPPLTNINAGTHHFKFKARVNPGSSAGLLDFGYITDVNDATTFVVLQSITISNGTYDNTSERVLDVPTSVPANARLAIRNPGTTFAGHYWDDAVWEPKSGLGTHETNISRTEIYPNPFTDGFTITDIKDVETLTINDISGKLIRIVEKPSAQVNLSDLKVGVYFATLQWKDGKSQTIKMIKK